MSWSRDENEVQICSNHPKRPTQMIWTFAFDGCEWWCPACGAAGGMFGTGRDVPWTWKIHDRYIHDLQRSKNFLTAVSTLSCAEFKYKGKWIKPSEMPKSLKNYYQNVIKKWKYIV